MKETAVKAMKEDIPDVPEAGDEVAQFVPYGMDGSAANITTTQLQ